LQWVGATVGNNLLIDNVNSNAAVINNDNVDSGAAAIDNDNVDFGAAAIDNSP
jgi:hypothetical protein